uniref:WD_REPEATS_REGION domain-containing protein n=1 Tax=Mesocestoides corti TaxID=53468 RepID=A0A5K3ENX7_MESCO
MVRVVKLLMCGASGVGKTSLVYSLDTPSGSMPDLQRHLPTYEDTYLLNVYAEKNIQEKVRLYEIGGSNTTIARHFVHSSDAVIFVFDLTDFDSFLYMQKLKSTIDLLKEKREIPMVAIGNKNDKTRNPKFDQVSPSTWAQSERVGYFETNVGDKTTFPQVLAGLVLKVIQPPGKSSFAFGKRESR